MCLFSLVYSNLVVSDYKVSALLAYNEIIPHTLSVAQNRISRTSLPKNKRYTAIPHQPFLQLIVHVLPASYLLAL